VSHKDSKDLHSIKRKQWNTQQDLNRENALQPAGSANERHLPHPSLPVLGKKPLLLEERDSSPPPFGPTTPCIGPRVYHPFSSRPPHQVLHVSDTLFSQPAGRDAGREQVTPAHGFGFEKPALPSFRHPGLLAASTGNRSCRLLRYPLQTSKGLFHPNTSEAGPTSSRR